MEDVVEQDKLIEIRSKYQGTSAKDSGMEKDFADSEPPDRRPAVLDNVVHSSRHGGQTSTRKGGDSSEWYSVPVAAQRSAPC